MVKQMSADMKLSRRDFLKLMALAPAALAARPLVSLLDNGLDSASPHILVFVFDAWSAHHLQLHGYPRDTMPNLTRFADAYRLQAQAWVGAIAGGASVGASDGASAWDGYAAAAVAEAGLQSLAENRSVPISLSEKLALYA